MSDDLRIVGQRALVTGGTKGIGEAVVARLREPARRFSSPRARGPTSFAPDNLFVAADVATAEGCAAVARGDGATRRHRYHGPCRRRLIGSRRRLRSARRERVASRAEPKSVSRCSA